MSTYAKHLSSPSSSSEPLSGQVPNSTGGFVFPVDMWARLDRFLVLGSEGGSYYAGEKALTLENAKCVEECAITSGFRTVNRIVEISDSGRAPKNEPALMALAICAKHGDLVTRQMAFEALPKVARTGTHLFHFAEYVKALGGWGRATTRAFSRWYTEMDAERLALQAVKYQQRDGWSHRDILRKAHPKTGDATKNAVLNWMVKGWPSVGEIPHEDPALVKIWAFERAKTATSKELVKLISVYGLPHECVPNERKGLPEVWEAMLPSMGLTAMIRNLGKMTSVGLIAPLSAASKLVAERLGDVDMMRKARIHPLSLLVAQKVYAQGHGDKGSLSWKPDSRVVGALDRAFYASFKAVEPTGKRHLLAIDVSSSMAWKDIAGMIGITPRVGAGVMSLVTANVEEQSAFMAFCHELQPLAISPRQRLDNVVRTMDDMSFGGTDCSLPMVWAAQNKVPVDVFCVYTDSETNCGTHPTLALKEYRQKMGIPAKLVVVGMVSNGFSVADPSDGGQMDVVGFDTATPSIISNFARG